MICSLHDSHHGDVFQVVAQLHAQEAAAREKIKDSPIFAAAGTRFSNLFSAFLFCTYHGEW
jgi:hypothetical protein